MFQEEHIRIISSCIFTSQRENRQLYGRVYEPHRTLRDLLPLLIVRDDLRCDGYRTVVPAETFFNIECAIADIAGVDFFPLNRIEAPTESAAYGLPSICQDDVQSNFRRAVDGV